MPDRVDRQARPRRRDRRSSCRRTSGCSILAGQYIDFLLKDGRRRSFSLATPPHDDALLELHIRHVPGGFFTDQLFTQYKGREILRFEGPLGTFFLREESDKPIIFVAGGTGFAPIKAMIEHALHHEHRARPMVLYWGVRAQRDLYLPDLPGQVAAAQPQLHVHPGAVGAARRRTLARPHRLRAPGGAGRFRAICPAIRSTPAAGRR